VTEFGGGFWQRNLFSKVCFAEVFKDETAVSLLNRDLSRTPLRSIIYLLDLLFYNRKLRRMVAVELKLDKFKPADKGQTKLYLRWLEKYEQEPGEETPIGLILCASKSEEQSELL
jgi:hypothetical protein